MHYIYNHGALNLEEYTFARAIRIYLQDTIAIVDRIDTHLVSAHKSADESHVGAFKLMLENTTALSGVKADFSKKVVI